MAWFPASSLNDGVAKREVFAWAMYDFANSGYTTVVLTAVYNAYFVGVVAQKADWATFAWTCALAVSSAIVMFAMPALGAYADANAAKKRLLGAATIGCVLGTVALAFTGEGTVALAVAAIIISNACYSMGDSLIAAFLPELAKRESLGTVSGWGWSFGYFGGMLALGLGLGYVLWATAQGIPASKFVPVTMLITAVIYGASCLVTFAWLKERAALAPPVEGAGTGATNESAFARLRSTWRESAKYKDFKALLTCAVAYQAGISVVIALSAVYAEQVLGFKQTDTMMLIFLVNIAAAAGAFAFGYLQDRVGHKAALSSTLVGWIVMTVMAMLATSAWIFWIAAVIAGLCMGSSQSAGRAMAGALAPPHRVGEFFGLWTFATRFASIIGPLTYGLVTWATSGNHRLAILSTALFFVAGLVLLRPVDMARGARVAMGR
jgi:MFS transporter, UMF1 family